MRFLWIVVVVLLATLVATMGNAPSATGALQKPAYSSGDRWVYDLRGSLDAFPGTNASDVGTFSFGLVGRVEVAILGADQALVDGVSTSVVRVETRASGFLNGTFSAPGLPGTGTVSGTFSSLTTDLWETQAYLPVASEGTTTYLATISFLVTIDFSASIRLNATTAYASIPAFDLDVGESATTPYTTDVLANTTATFSGETFTSENVTSLSSTWTREVLRETTVAVDAGMFSAYEMNQTLTVFPGLAGFVPTNRANETAYFSNSAGNYVKRDAYANGTRVAEISLVSYSYGPGSSGLSIVDLSLIVGVPIVALLAVLVWLRRRKKKAPAPPEGEPRAR